KATAPTPQFDVSAAGDKSGRYQAGARLLISWRVVHSTVGKVDRTCTVDAELSLVLASMDSSLDPGSVMAGCKLYPQLAIRVRSIANGVPAVTALKGAITLVANNADAGTLTGTLKSLATGHLTTSAFCESNRASAGGAISSPGVGLDNRKLAKLALTTPSPARLSPPPQWSWVYDYCNTNLTTRTPFAAAYSRADGNQGAESRDFTAASGSGPQTPPTVHKVPRQAAYDSLVIHPDRGADSTGAPQVAAPVCADL